MASVKYRPNRDASGKEHGRLFKLQRDAKALLDAVTASQVRGDYVDPRDGKTTLSEWTDRYFATTPKRATTMARDKLVMEKHPEPLLGSMPLVSIRPVDVQATVTKMTSTLAPRTVRTTSALSARS